MSASFLSMCLVDQILSLILWHNELIVPVVTFQLIESWVEHSPHQEEMIPLSPQDLSFPMLESIVVCIYGFNTPGRPTHRILFGVASSPRCCPFL